MSPAPQHSSTRSPPADERGHSERGVDVSSVHELFDGMAELSFLLNDAIDLAGAGQFTSNRDMQVLATLRLEGPQRPRDLATVTGLTSGGVTNLIDRLVRADLVERHRHISGDRRGVQVALTDDGRRTLARVAAAIGGVFRLAVPHLDRWRDAFISMGIEVGPLPRLGGGLRAELERINRIATAARVLRPTYDDSFGLDDPTPGFTALVISLAARPGGCRPREIVTMSRLSSAGVTELIDRAERAGYVTRMSGTTDRRAVIVTATEHGRDVLQHVLEGVGEAMPTIAHALFPT